MSHHLEFSTNGAAKNYVGSAETNGKLYDSFDTVSQKTGVASDAMITEVSGSIHIAVIDYRKLELECLIRGFRSRNANIEASAFSSIDAWRNAAEFHSRASAILFNIGWRNATDPDVVEAVRSLTADFEEIPTIVIGDVEDMTHVMKILEYGARGYIPTSVGLDVAIEAVRLARAGGIFVPASSLVSFQQHMSGEKPTQNGAMNSKLVGSGLGTNWG